MRTHPALVATAALLLAACAPPAEPPLPGYAEADLVFIAPSSAGVLQSVAVRRGDAVARGQPLFALDTDAEALGSDAADARQARARSALANLPEEQATIVRLSFYEEKPHAEIAAQLGIPLGTVKSRMRLAFNRFRKALGEPEL